MIEQHLDLKAPAKFVRDLSKSCMRELTMAGTFEQAQKILLEKNLDDENAMTNLDFDEFWDGVEL